MLSIGDRVRATRDLSYGIIPKGIKGVVVDKFTPHWATACWTVTIDFEVEGFDECRKRLDYPAGGLVEKI